VALTHCQPDQVYNKVFVRWTTHRPPGLSDKDLQMATHCSSLAAELGDVADSGETISFAAPKGG
jgi:4a-hydroxytetrahydrobiopterin dehydratase